MLEDVQHGLRVLESSADMSTWPFFGLGCHVYLPRGLATESFSHMSPRLIVVFPALTSCATNPPFMDCARDPLNRVRHRARPWHSQVQQSIQDQWQHVSPTPPCYDSDIRVALLAKPAKLIMGRALPRQTQGAACPVDGSRYVVNSTTSCRPAGFVLP